MAQYVASDQGLLCLHPTPLLFEIGSSKWYKGLIQFHIGNDTLPHLAYFPRKLYTYVISNIIIVIV